MNKEIYSFENHEFTYTFISEGKKGSIVKMFDFQAISLNVFNLALGDFDPETGFLDAEIVSDNGDMPKVLATVWQILKNFLDNFPDKIVYIKGSNELRQKLYNRLIKNNLQIVQNQYIIFGVLVDGEIEEFDSVKFYDALLIKKINFADNED